MPCLSDRPEKKRPSITSFGHAAFEGGCGSAVLILTR